MTIGEKIKEIRVRHGWSQRQLGHYAGISGSYITQIESGRSQPSIKALAKIAEALVVNLGDLIEGEHPLSQHVIVTAKGEKLVFNQSPLEHEYKTKGEAIEVLDDMLAVLDLEDIQAITKIVYKLVALYDIKAVWDQLTDNDPEVKGSVQRVRVDPTQSNDFFSSKSGGTPSAQSSWHNRASRPVRHRQAKGPIQGVLVASAPSGKRLNPTSHSSPSSRPGLRQRKALPGIRQKTGPAGTK